MTCRDHGAVEGWWACLGPTGVGGHPELPSVPLARPGSHWWQGWLWDAGPGVPEAPKGPRRWSLNIWSWGCLPAPWPRAKGSGRGASPCVWNPPTRVLASTCWEPALCHEKGVRRGGGGGRPGAQGLGVMQQLRPRAWPQTSPPSASHVATSGCDSQVRD